MIYLLKALNSFSGYFLLERTADSEIFYNNGDWIDVAPTSFIDPDIYPLELKNGKPINWWHTRHFDYTDAELVVRRKTREGYLKWLADHPELLI